MKKIIAGTCALGLSALSFTALANPAEHPKPATECADKGGHGTHSADPHACDHSKPAGSH